jgi:hypothetical protein
MDEGGGVYGGSRGGGRSMESNWADFKVMVGIGNQVLMSGTHTFRQEK